MVGRGLPEQPQQQPRAFYQLQQQVVNAAANGAPAAMASAPAQLPPAPRSLPPEAMPSPASFTPTVHQRAAVYPQQPQQFSLQYHTPLPTPQAQQQRPVVDAQTQWRGAPAPAPAAAPPAFPQQRAASSMAGTLAPAVAMPAPRSSFDAEFGDGSELMGVDDFQLDSRRSFTTRAQQQQQRSRLAAADYRPPPFPMTQEPSRAPPVSPPAPSHVPAAIQHPPAGAAVSHAPYPVPRRYLEEDDDDSWLVYENLPAEVLQPPRIQQNDLQQQHLAVRQSLPPQQEQQQPQQQQRQHRPQQAAELVATPPAKPLTPTKRPRGDAAEWAEARQQQPHHPQQPQPPQQESAMLAAPQRRDSAFDAHLRSVLTAASSAVQARTSSDVSVKQEMTEKEQRMQAEMIAMKKEIAKLKRDVSSASRPQHPAAAGTSLTNCRTRVCCCCCSTRSSS